MDPKTRITSAKAMEDEYFQDKVDGLPQGNYIEINICKVGCPYYGRLITTAPSEIRPTCTLFESKNF